MADDKDDAVRDAGNPWLAKLRRDVNTASQPADGKRGTSDTPVLPPDGLVHVRWQMELLIEAAIRDGGEVEVPCCDLLFRAGDLILQWAGFIDGLAIVMGRDGQTRPVDMFHTREHHSKPPWEQRRFWKRPAAVQMKRSDGE